MKKLIDNYKHKGLRQKLVAELRRKGIKDERILSAIGKIPRHQFLDRAFEDWAYRDTPFPIEADQTISQPYTVAFQTQLLEIKPGDKVLEIGTGSGYQAIVLFLLGAKVYSIERQKKLFEITSSLLEQMGYPGIRTLYGDGMKGAPRFAPFDKILVTAGAKEVPEDLKKQLRVGGYLVIPVGGREIQKMLRVTRLSEEEYEEEVFGNFSFVPLLGGVNKDV